MTTPTQTQTGSAEEPIGARWERLLGERLGRYQVQQRLGAGAMGVVYAGLDPKLGREVAIKLSYEQRPRDLRRFVREARSMAAVDHPNVVTVFDYGVRDSQPYLVMEVLPGGTLRSARGNATREERLLLLLQAGRGLEAAHRVGIVHRDFKPNNVLLDGEGSAVVTDFGLAVFVPESTDPGTSADGRAGSTLAAGTPAYMSPEQHKGQWSDARTDQYSFCVTAVEMLTWQRPFHRGGEGGLLGSKERGIAPHAMEALPVHLRRALQRGLELSPEARFPDMGALLEALETPSGRDRWARAGATVGLTLCVAGAGLTAAEAMDSGCPAVEMPGWDRLGKAEFLKQQRRTTLTHPRASERVVDLLDAYANSWTDARRRSCEQARPPRTFACLDVRARAFSGLVARLGRGGTDPSAATVLALELEPSSPCLAVVDEAQLDRESAAFVRESNRLIAEAEDSLHQGRATEARQALARAEQAALRITVAGKRGGQLAKIGDVLDTAGDAEAARTILLAALATAPHDDQVETLASISLGWTVGISLGDVEGGKRWLRRAMAAMERSDASLVLRLRAQSHAATLEVEGGDLQGALDRLREARDLVAGSAPSESPLEQAARLRRWAEIEHNICTAQLWSGEHLDALASCQQAVSLWERALHEDHPEIASSLEGVFDASIALGQFDDARAAARRSLEILSSARGDQHPSLAPVHKQLAWVAYADGHLQDARVHLEQSIELLTLGDALRVHYRADLIDLLFELGRESDAAGRANALLAQLEEDRRPELRAPRASVLRTVAVLRLVDSDYSGAVGAMERAYEAAEGTQFLADNAVLFAATAARVYRHAGDHAEAIKAATAALPEDSDPAAAEAQELRVELIRALLDAGDMQAARTEFEAWLRWADDGDATAAELRAELRNPQSTSSAPLVSSE